MKKSIKILLIILSVILVITAAVVIWQFDNISALIIGLSNSSDDLAAKMDDHRNKVKTEVEKYISKPVDDISAEDEQKLLKGQISVEEIAEKYKLPIEYMRDGDLEADINKDNNDKNPYDSKPDTTYLPLDDNKIIEKEIGDSIAQMYALKAKYVNKLGELEREVIEQYKNLPKSKQNKEGKKELLMANIGYVASLEETCDTEVNKLLISLEKNLKELDGDLEIIKILTDAYAEEKELKKSYYLSIYN